MNDSGAAAIGYLVGVGGVIFLYVRAYIALIRIEKNTKAAADALKESQEETRAAIRAMNYAGVVGATRAPFVGGGA